MATNRAAKSGFAAEAQRKVFSAFLLIKNYKKSAFCNLDENIWHLLNTQAQIPYANSLFFLAFMRYVKT